MVETGTTKKPAIASSQPAKPTHTAKENLPIHEAVTPNAETNNQGANNVSPNNKAIDVPYRYSE